MKKKYLYTACLFLLLFQAGKAIIAEEVDRDIVLRPRLVSVQPIVVRGDDGKEPAPMIIHERLVNQAFAPAGIQFFFLEPVFFDNTRARDGLINLDEIVRMTTGNGVMKGNGDVINLFFINAVDGKRGPLGRAMEGGHIAFLALGNEAKDNDPNMQAFAMAHELAHNLGLGHAADDPNIPEKSPNLMGEGDFADRIGPKSLTPYQVEIIGKSRLVRPRVDVLNKAEGSEQISDMTFDSFFSWIQAKELAAYTRKSVDGGSLKNLPEEAKQRFAQAVLDFTPEECDCLNWVADRTNRLFIDQGMPGMAMFPWRFIKVENWLCGGFSFTRGLCIVLSERRLQFFTKVWREAVNAGDPSRAVSRIAPLLVHERLHTLQRVFPRKFADLYQKEWGYVRGHVKTDENLELLRVTNPDAPLSEWLIPVDESQERFFWIRVFFEGDSRIPSPGEDFVEKVCEVARQGGEWNLVYKSGQPLAFPLSRADFFTRRFPVTTGIDHPNEIAAYMFVRFFRNEILQEPEDSELEGDALTVYSHFASWCRETFR